LYSFYFCSQQKLRARMWRDFKHVQGLHKRLTGFGAELNRRRSRERRIPPFGAQGTAEERRSRGGR